MHSTFYPTYCVSLDEELNGKLNGLDKNDEDFEIVEANANESESDFEPNLEPLIVYFSDEEELNASDMDE